jgi:predicted DNA-binding transcriptional regulator YafY
VTVVVSKRRDRQVVRILGILGALPEGGQPSIKQLASRYGTRRETIYRDIRALEDAGYPVTGDDRGRLSHPRLLPEARRHAPHLKFTDVELTSLLWASMQAGSGSPFGETLEVATAKLRAMAVGDFASDRAGIENAFDSAAASAKDYRPHKDTILRLVDAIIRRRRCALKYQAPASSAVKSYEYEPYRLLSVSGGLYCLGKVPPYKNVTTLAVERITAIKIGETEFTLDPGIDIERDRQEAFGVIWEKPRNITLRFSADQAPYVRERQWHPTQRLRELRDSCLELTFRAGGTFEIVRWVLGWGAAVEVISPRELRNDVQRILAAALSKYEKTAIPQTSRNEPRSGGKRSQPGRATSMSRVTLKSTLSPL